MVMSRNSRVTRLVVDFILPAIAVLSVRLAGCAGQPAAPQACPRKAADLGQTKAQYELGTRYLQGHGSPA
jgi:hypothetical protein